jgi:hypothetical protein
MTTRRWRRPFGPPTANYATTGLQQHQGTRPNEGDAWRPWIKWRGEKSRPSVEHGRRPDVCLGRAARLRISVRCRPEPSSQLRRGSRGASAPQPSRGSEWCESSTASRGHLPSLVAAAPLPGLPALISSARRHAPLSVVRSCSSGTTTSFVYSGWTGSCIEQQHETRAGSHKRPRRHHRPHPAPQPQGGTLSLD